MKENAIDLLENIDVLVREYIPAIIEFSLNLLLGLAILIVGKRLIKSFRRRLKKYLEKREANPMVSVFIIRIMSIFLWVALLILVLTLLGFKTGSLVVFLGSLGFAVGMALSGTLQNFAGGIVILILRPFQVGDVIKAQDYIGKVDSVQLFNTVMIQLDNSKIILPNGPLSSGVVLNITTNPRKRGNWVFGISYGDDFLKAKKLLLDFCEKNNKILNEPNKPFIVLSKLADSSVNITFRVWLATEDYWDVFYNLNEFVYTEFPKHGLSIPFPQVDVHVHNKD